MRIITLLVTVLALTGCAGTQNAYKAADGLEETAYVMNQHYLALVREANDLRAEGVLSGAALVETQDAVRKTREPMRELSQAAQAYSAVQNAATEDELTLAIAQAATALSELINAIREAT